MGILYQYRSHKKTAAGPPRVSSFDPKMVNEALRSLIDLQSGAFCGRGNQKLTIFALRAIRSEKTTLHLPPIKTHNLMSRV